MYPPQEDTVVEVSPYPIAIHIGSRYGRCPDAWYLGKSARLASRPRIQMKPTTQDKYATVEASGRTLNSSI